MNNEDEYIVYVEEIGNRFYYKNGKLHREAGPAYVPWCDKEKYTGLSDQDLYKLKCRKHVDDPQYKSVYYIDEPMFPYLDKAGLPVKIKLTEKQLEDKLRIRPKYPCYHLEGIEYQKEEFDAIILDKELSTNSKIKQKFKV